MAIKIEKMSNGTYAVRVWAKYRDIFGKRKTKYKSGIKTLSAASRWGEETEALLTDTNFNNTDIDFATLNDLYLEAKKNKISPTTLDKTSYIVERILKYLGQVKIKDINTRVVQQFINYLATLPNKNNPTEKLKKGTIEKYYKYIQAVLNWGVAQDYLEYNRVKRVEFPEDKNDFEPTILNAQQLGELLAFLKKNFYNLYIPVLLSCTTSARRGEYLGIKWDAIDFENDTIDIKNNRVSVKNEVFDKTKLKTSKSKRLLPMSNFVKKELLEHKELCKYLNSPYVCANPFTGELPTNPTYITKVFHDVVKENFGIKMRAHDLRHCFNQLAYEENIDETTRIKLMGHSNVDINRNIYTHQSLKKNKEAMDLISNNIEQAFSKTII